MSPKVKPHKYANDLPLFSHFDPIFMHICMVVLMDMIMFRCICDAFDILKPVVVPMARFAHTARLILRKFLRAIHCRRSTAFMMRLV